MQHRFMAIPPDNFQSDLREKINVHKLLFTEQAANGSMTIKPETKTDLRGPT